MSTRAEQVDRALTLAVGLVGFVAALWYTRALAFPLDFDTAYYRGMGRFLAEGGSLAAEPIVWTYLGGAQTVPHAAFDYWMPLPAFGAALGYALFGTVASTAYAGAACAGVLAASTSVLARRWAAAGGQVGTTNRAPWWVGPLAGLGVLVSPHVLDLCADGDSPAFATAAFAAALVVLPREGSTRPRLRRLAVGALLGLAHLSRGDGVLLLAAVLLVVGWTARRGGLRAAAVSVASVLAGWAVVFAPWMVRNAVTFGSLMPPGSSAALGIDTPDGLYAWFPTASPWSHGPEHAVRVLTHGAAAVGANLARFTAWPLVLPAVWGVWTARRSTSAAAAVLALLAVVVFYATLGAVVGGSQRGLMPLTVVVVAGASAATLHAAAWIRRRRGRAALAAPIALLAWVGVGASGLPADRAAAAADADVIARRHAVLEDTLDTHFAGETVMTASHSRVWFGTSAPTVALPLDGLEAIHAAAAATGATVLLLDGYVISPPRPGTAAMHALFTEQAQVPGFRLLGDSGGYRVYRITPPR